MNNRHPSHVTRVSDASSFDEVCINCNATDGIGTWGDLAYPCRNAPPTDQERCVTKGDMYCSHSYTCDVSLQEKSPDEKPSKATIEKANALVRSVTPENVLSSAKINPAQNYVEDAFARFIDHVSEVAKDITQGQGKVQALLQFILPDPEPDVLAEDSDWPAELVERLVKLAERQGILVRKVQP